jgi:hypothetical protein
VTFGGDMHAEQRFDHAGHPRDFTAGWRYGSADYKPFLQRAHPCAATTPITRTGGVGTMSTSIKLTSDSLAVHIESTDKLWALRSELQIPLVNVINVHQAREEADTWLHGMQVGGTHTPGVISAGRFYSYGQLVFWDVHEPDKAIAIELRDERYDRLVIEVENREEDIVRIREAIATAPAPAASASTKNRTFVPDLKAATERAREANKHLLEAGRKVSSACLDGLEKYVVGLARSK